MTILLISDLHLKAERPDITRAFLDFLQHTATQADALYLLGDIFEVWIGDDAQPPSLSPITQVLRALSNQGCKLYFQHGNRDFLVGHEYLSSINAQLLADEALIALPTSTALVMHGDQLCTDDTEYQAFKSIVRDKHWQTDFLSKTLAERISIAQGLRDTSKKRGAEKEYSIMDVNQQSVLDVLSQHNTHLLIHGHTHRPATHSLTMPSGEATRIVLGDWDKQLWYLRCDETGNKLISQPIPPSP